MPRSRSILLPALLVFVILWVATPVFLIMPFKSQTPWMLTVSYFLKRWSPWVTAVGLVIALILTWRLWQVGAGRWQRVLTLLALVPLAGAAWFARQNHFEWMFNPLANAAYAKTSEAGFVDDADIVLAVENNGDAAAYPVRLMAYHHVVHDRVGGTPIVATY